MKSLKQDSCHLPPPSLLQPFPVKVTEDKCAGSHVLTVKVVSSANVLGTNYIGQAGRSLIQIRNNGGPRIEPCGTSQVTGSLHEKTRTGTSLTLGGLFDFVSRLHDDWVISYLVIQRYISC